MKTFCSVLALALIALGAAAEEHTFSLGSGAQMTLTTPTNILVKENQKLTGWSAVLVLTEGSNSLMKLIVVPLLPQQTMAEIKRQILADARTKSLPNAVEKEIVAKDISGEKWSGFYFQLTDARKSEETKYMTKGVIVKSGFAFHFVIGSKERSHSDEDLIDCLKQMRVTTTK